MFGMHPVDGDADRGAILEGVFLALAARAQPSDQVARGDHLGRRIQNFLRNADALTHPGKIDGFHAFASVSKMCRIPDRR